MCCIQNIISLRGWLNRLFLFLQRQQPFLCLMQKGSPGGDGGQFSRKWFPFFGRNFYGVLKKEGKKRGRVLLKQSKLTLKKAVFSFLFSLGLISKPRKADWNLFCFVAFVERRVCIPPPLYLSFYLTLLFPFQNPSGVKN